MEFHSKRVRSQNDPIISNCLPRGPRARPSSGAKRHFLLQPSRANNEKFRPILGKTRVRCTWRAKEIEGKVARLAQRWKTMAWRSRGATDFPRTSGEVAGLLHYLAWNDDVVPWGMYVCVPRSRGKSTDTFFMTFRMKPKLCNTKKLWRKRRRRRRRRRKKRTRVCVCVCVCVCAKEAGSTSGSNQMRVNPGCFSALKDPPHVGDETGRSALWPCERSILQARPLGRSKVSSNVTLESFELRVSSVQFLRTSLLGQRGSGMKFSITYSRLNNVLQ